MKKLLFFILSLLLVPIIFLIIDGIYNDSYKRDLTTYIIVYGSKIQENGAPSERLKARLDTGYLVFLDGGKKIIVSGGIGIEGFDEAEVMKTYLMEKGITEKNIIVDSDGYTTRRTSENARKIIESLEKDVSKIQVIGVSQWFHIGRVKLSLRQAGFQEAYGKAPKYFEMRDIYSVLRELPAYIKYSLQDIIDSNTL